MVKELEKRGIGRPSITHHHFHHPERGYVSLKIAVSTLKDGRHSHQPLGRKLRRSDGLQLYRQYGKKLDHIAEGDSNWKAVLDEFYKGFKSKLDAAQDSDGMR